jgi:hypothetical protein
MASRHRFPVRLERSEIRVACSGGLRPQCTRSGSARAGDALAFPRNDLTENMHEACARRVEVLMTTGASAAIVVRTGL